jgi:hypothetical protein
MQSFYTFRTKPTKNWHCLLFFSDPRTIFEQMFFERNIIDFFVIKLNIMLLNCIIIEVQRLHIFIKLLNTGVNFTHIFRAAFVPI